MNTNSTRALDRDQSPVAALPVHPSRATGHSLPTPPTLALGSWPVALSDFTISAFQRFSVSAHLPLATRHLPPTFFLAFVLVWLASALPGFGAEPAGSLQPLFVTNYVVVTNIVLVTNYVTLPEVAPGDGRLTANRTNSALPDLSWVPPQDSFDWIQLKSGEWLKGRLKAMQERKLEFDSDELNDLTFDWKDIRQVRSPAPSTCYL